jgi:hypothetical protein
MAEITGRTPTSDTQPAESSTPVEEFHPRGTLLILLIYLVLIIVLWGLMFLTMLERS